MTNKRINTNKGNAFEKSLTSFGRWFCGLDEPSNRLNRSRDSNFRNSNFNGRSSQNNKTGLNSSHSNLSYTHSISVDQKNTESWYQSLSQSFTSWCSHDWLRPLPGLSVATVESFDSTSSNMRGAFFRHGSDFLRYKQENTGRKCSRFALFLAGTAMSRADVLVQSSYAPKKFISATALGSSLTTGSKNRSYQSPSYQWALESYVDPAANISNVFQLPTAIAVALPLAISTVQVLSSLNAPIQKNEVKRDAIAPEALDVKPATQQPEIPTTADIAITMTPPTGKLANIQNYVLPAKGDFTSHYGWRWGRMHRGIDIAGPVGTPVVAAASGKVISAGWKYDGFGYRVEIEHPDKTVTLYAHNNKVLVKVGQHVQQGSQIAEMGSTGSSTGPHVHFQMHPKGGEAIDPATFIGKQLKTLDSSQQNS
jgi:murein DD-endopeptidase MepM/ murein hydrolase activator NlpD